MQLTATIYRKELLARIFSIPINTVHAITLWLAADVIATILILRSSMSGSRYLYGTRSAA